MIAIMQDLPNFKPLVQGQVMFDSTKRKNCFCFVLFFRMTLALNWIHLKGKVINILLKVELISDDFCFFKEIIVCCFILTVLNSC